MDFGPWRPRRVAGDRAAGLRLGCCLSVGAMAVTVMGCSISWATAARSLSISSSNRLRCSALAFRLGGKLQPFEPGVLVDQLLIDCPLVAQLGQQLLGHLPQLRTPVLPAFAHQSPWPVVCPPSTGITIGNSPIASGVRAPEDSDDGNSDLANPRVAKGSPSTKACKLCVFDCRLGYPAQSRQTCSWCSRQAASHPAIVHQVLMRLALIVWHRRGGGGRH